jgi:multidrug efflux pump subunit AcrB
VANITIDQTGWQAVEYELVGAIHRDALMRYGVGIEEFMAGVAAKMNRSLERQWLPMADESVRFSMSLANANHRQGSNDLEARELSGSAVMIRNRTVPVGDIMTITAQPVMGEIKREDQQYSRTISYEFKGPFKLGDRYLDTILNSLRLPVGYEARRPDWMFTFGEKDAIPMIAIALISILMVFMITASLYESLRKPFIILLAVPMSLAGLFLGFYLFDINFSRGGYAAVILLIGLSVNNGIILVDRMAHLASRADASRHDAIVTAVLQRTRPILITTLTTVAGFLPFVIQADIYSFWYSFSFAVICGLSVSTVMILLVMPVLFRVWAR